MDGRGDTEKDVVEVHRIGFVCALCSQAVWIERSHSTQSLSHVIEVLDHELNPRERGSMMEGPLCEDCLVHSLNEMRQLEEEFDVLEASLDSALRLEPSSSSSCIFPPDSVSDDSVATVTGVEDEGGQREEIGEGRMRKDRDDDDAKLWDSLLAAEEQLERVGKDIEPLCMRQVYMDMLFERLQSESVLHHCFHITARGHFGEMNGLRIGRFPAIPVDWMEINTGLGFVCGLLVCLEALERYRFKRFRIVPQGHSSYLDEFGKTKRKHDLVGGSGSLFWKRHFDEALFSLLICVDELNHVYERKYDCFSLPYSISVTDGTVGGVPVRYSSGSEESWTRAMKFFLCDLKYFIAWTPQ